MERGELDDATRREIGLHLAECDECAALSGRERFWDESLLRHLDHELPPDLRAGILGDLADLDERTARTPDAAAADRSGWRLIVGVARREVTQPLRLLRTAAVAAGALLAVWWWSGDSGRPVQPFTQAAPVIPVEQQTAFEQGETPPTGRLSLSGRLI